MARSSPAKSSTNRPGSGWPRSDRAASRSAPAQPSVCCHSRRRSSASSDRPTAASISPASASVMASAGCRISAIRSCMRSRARRMGGSARVAITSRSAAGGWCSSWSRSACAAGPASRKSSSTSTIGSVRSSSAAARAATRRSTRRCGWRARASTASPAPARPSASRTASQNGRRSAVAASRDSHATGPGDRPAPIQLASRTVLPAPGGADRSVRGPSVPASSASNRRGRAMIVAWSAGTANMVAGRRSAIVTGEEWATPGPGKGGRER